MSHAPLPVNRFLVLPQYSVYYRHLRRFHWVSEVRVDYGLFVLLDGQVELKAPEVCTRMVQSQALIIQPGTQIGVSGKEVKMLLLTLSPAFVLDFAVRARLVGSGATVAFSETMIEGDRRLLGLAEELALELSREEPGREIVISAILEQVVVHLLRRYSNMRRSGELELSRVGLIDRRIRRAVELMQAQLDHDLSLREIAAACYLSPFHFSRLFKKLTGTSPHAYLASLRASRAQALLAETDLSITEIGTRVGYSGPSHFTRAFRQATGLTPRAFRKALVSR
jgi:AraC-like DNA-binding protein